MKVLGFVGSPRKKGNTDVLVDTFLDGASSGGAEVKKFFLANHTINQCMGCYRKCILKPGFRCGTFRDDMDLLLQEMVSSNLILFASPYYCASYTAIMAKFLERCLPLWEVEIAGEMGTMEAFKFINNHLKGKKAVIGLGSACSQSIRRNPGKNLHDGDCRYDSRDRCKGCWRHEQKNRCA
jgi:multimeric flavodoxin WrbA